MPQITNDEAAKILHKISLSLVMWMATCPCSCKGCSTLRKLVLESWPKSTPEEIEEHRRSFAYGNVALHNPSITRADVDRVADEMAANGKR
jgi:hypothetical protein